MVASTKAGLAYYEKNFSPYQFRQSASSSFPVTAPSRSPSQHRTLLRIWFLGRVPQAPGRYRLDLLCHCPRAAHNGGATSSSAPARKGSNMMSEASGRVLSTARDAKEVTATIRCGSSSGMSSMATFVAAHKRGPARTSMFSCSANPMFGIRRDRSSSCSL